VRPLIAERAADAEAQRKPDDEVIEALKATGVFRSFVPARFGGYEIDLDLFVDLGIAVSEACASTGWITTFYMEHNWLLGMFARDLQEEIFARQPFVLAPGSVNPKDGLAAPKGEGFELTGHWRFGTGIVHADWVLLSARVATEAPGPPRMFLVRPEQVEVRDTWHVDGMAATGSRDIVANAVFVPARNVSLIAPAPAASAGVVPGYLARLPIPPMLSLTAAIPSLGAARRAVELFKKLLHERVPFGTSKVQAQRAPAQMRLAHALADVRAAETVLRGVARDVTAHARGGPQLSFLDQVQMRLTIAHVVRDCRKVVRHVVEGSGASVHYLDHELQRISRDVQMMSAHTVFDLDLVAEQCGRALLESEAPLFP
jgi:3-hydroxy-9,10-secoandrosta-1,3,5(10)-triene-9,17-dione monooxygenase